VGIALPLAARYGGTYENATSQENVFSLVLYIPARRKRSEAERAALKEASARWQEVLDSSGISEEEAVTDFKRWRAKPKR
jgi:hypothetical protein